MRYSLRPLIFLLLFVHSWDAAAAPAPGSDALPPAVAGKVAKIQQAGGTAADAGATAAYFSDPHPRVRLAAYGKLISQALEDPAIVVSLIRAAEEDPDAAAREQAGNTLKSIRGRVDAPE